MPPKIRDLIAQPGAEGFRNRGGKGSPHGLRLTISGKLGADPLPEPKSSVLQTA